jgi:sigma-B regulation protein RsbU (phosphoserine phosphatase)
VPVVASPQWPAFPRRSLAGNSLVKGLSEQVLRGGIPVHDIGRIGAEKYLISALPGNHLDGYVLVLAQPYSVIEKKMTEIKRRVYILAFLVIVIALISAKIISLFLLKPLQTIGLGLQAVSAGNFRLQLENSGVEDFFLMTKSLNQTLSGLQELQVARNVQETLWPEQNLFGKDWQLCGKCITATELGGDHFDWIKLSDGRILLVAGDVTGHGIAPAMIQASIKVWLTLCAEKAESASDLLMEINRLYCRYGAKKLYMTCWVGFFSPDDGGLDFAAAGHPYPFIVHADAGIDCLNLQGMPLGIREKIRIGSGKRQLGPGDSLILYTDGIVEIKNRSGNLLGFEQFEKICQQTSGMSAEASVEYILKAAATWCG